MNVKTILATLCLGVTGIAFAGTPGEDSSMMVAASNGPSLTRAEVGADLNLWVRAGLSQYTTSEADPDFASANYREAYTRYLSLRNSAAYADEVQRIGEHRRESTELDIPG